MAANVFVCVMGVPGGGKTTQCEIAAAEMGFAVVSAPAGVPGAGDAAGAVLDLVDACGAGRPVLVDGFPRTEAELEALGDRRPAAVLFVDAASADVAERARAGAPPQSRVRRAFDDYAKGALPVLGRLRRAAGGVATVDGNAAPREVAREFAAALAPVAEAFLVALCRRTLGAIADGDYAGYEALCDAGMTAFEPEAQGHLVRGMAFHRYYFENGHRYGRSSIVDERVRLMGRAAVVTYVRLVQSQDPDGGGPRTGAYEETRVFHCGDAGWRSVHFHRSNAPLHR